MNKKKNKNKPTITDWIQTIMSIIGTLAAIIGLAFAWLSLTKSDKDLQSQINKLDTIANQSMKHTKLLTNQVELLTDELEYQKQQNEITQSHRQTDIEPKLTIEFEGYNGDVISARLINNGKPAKILKFVEKKGNEFIINIPFQYIGEGKEKEIFFKFKKPDERNEKTALNFILFYKDIENRIKSKEFYYVDLEKIIDDIYKVRIINI